MKRYIKTMALLLTLAGLASCSKDTEGLTSITYYPVIELDGPVYDQAVAGVPFTDPGYSATLDGEDITDQVKVVTDMDMANPAPGYYTISYQAVNADGFSAGATRYVLVSDADDKVSGYYTTSPDSYLDSGKETYYGGYSIIVVGNGDGKYAVSDLLGGWYSQRAGYGDSYAMQGEVAISDDGTVNLIDSYVPGWGDTAESWADGVCDPEAGTISWVVEYTTYGYFFHVTIVKN